MTPTRALPAPVPAALLTAAKAPAWVAPRAAGAGGPLAARRRPGDHRIARGAAANHPATRVGSTTDVAEREAEWVAREVPGASAGSVGRAAHAPAGAVPPAVTRGIAAARGGGRPLPERLRAQVERALGVELGGVRLHTGPAADRFAEALGATAFTSGSDVFLRHGTPGPETPAGWGVLAHELTHVAQGRDAPGPVPIRRVLAPQHLDPVNDPPSTAGWWPTSSGRFDPHDGVSTGTKKRAGSVEAVIPAGAPKGTPPNKETLLGWYWVRQFDGTAPGNGGWVRFHLLNQQLGGSGDTKENLVPTSGATNQDSRWTTNFDEVAQAAHRKGLHLHLIADVTFHPEVTGNPGQPGELHQHFFPSAVIGEYRWWDAKVDTWKKLATVKLSPIRKPPLNPSVVPVQLGSASEDQIGRTFRHLDPTFVHYLADPAIRRKLDALAAGSSLQQVYDILEDQATLYLSGTERFRRRGRTIVPTLDTDPAWWPALQALLVAPVAGPASGGQAKPLIVNENVDLVGKPHAVTATAKRRAAEAAEADARREAEVKKAQQAKAKKQRFSLDDVLAGMGRPPLG